MSDSVSRTSEILKKYGFDKNDLTTANIIQRNIELADISHEEKKRQTEELTELYKLLEKALEKSQRIESRHTTNKIDFEQLNSAIESGQRELKTEVNRLGVGTKPKAEFDSYIEKGGNKERLNRARKHTTTMLCLDGNACILRLQKNFSQKNQYVKEIGELTALWVFKKGRFPLTDPDTSSSKNNYFNFLADILGISSGSVFQKFKDIYDIEWKTPEKHGL